MNQKIYVVTAGAYSDYRIICMFSKHKDAKDFVARQNRAVTFSSDQYRVERYLLDEVQVIRSDEMAYRIQYNFDPGFFGTKHWWAGAYADHVDLPFTDVQPSISGECLATWVWAKDEQEALKKGADKITPVLAAQEIDFVYLANDGPDPYESLRKTLKL